MGIKKRDQSYQQDNCFHVVGEGEKGGASEDSQVSGWMMVPFAGKENTEGGAVLNDT